MKILDLYSGIGGFSLGFHRAGFETVAFCEIDKQCHKVLKKNFPNTPIFNDVKDLKIDDLPNDIDIIVGGFPCQDVSVAGKQRGLVDDEGKRTRSGLWFEFKRLIQEVEPRWVVIENVRNLLNNGFVTVLQDLHEIGYDAEWEIISARDVGAPHLRERVWIVAYPRCRSWRFINTSDTKTVGKGQDAGERIGCEDISKTQRPSVRQQTDTKRLEGDVTDSQRKRLERLFRKRRERREMGQQENEECSNSSLCEQSSKRDFPDSNDFRFWPAFTSTKEKQQWWSEATFGFSDWWEVESKFCRVADGLPKELDRGRAQRIKQLGNSIVPQIAEIIANRIKYHECH